MFSIIRYTPERAEEWNRFIESSKNGTFLFHRSYMDYHRHRFHDHSLMLYEKNRLFAICPGNEVEHVFWSHQGLTYGGLLLGPQATALAVCEAFQCLNEYLREHQFSRVIYKTVPWIYHSFPSEECIYALTHVCKAHFFDRDLSSVILLQHQLPFSESRRSGLRKALHQKLTVRESQDVAAFWHILEANLYHKYGVRPVHSCEEMQLLKSRFPLQIRLFMTYDAQDKPLGGTLLYLTETVVHTQYISASPEGKRVGALDLLFHHLLHETHFSQPYFDFGTSTDPMTDQINADLIFQKQGFGARGICYDKYEYCL